MKKESKRQRQVAETIKRNFSMILHQEGSYIYENALVTVTNVRMTPDFGLASIYLSVFNTENKPAVLVSMDQNKVRLRSALAQRVKKQMRRVPQIQFFLDETLDEIFRVDSLFDKLRDDDQMGAAESSEPE